MLLSHSTDLQATQAPVPLALDRVGVTGIVRGIVLGGMPTTARVEVATDLDARARGAHMSRFHEAIDRALSLVGDDGHDVTSLELLAAVIATQAAELQETARGHARVHATLAWPRQAPASGRRSIDPFEAWAVATVDRSGASSEVTIGVSATGMTACPCAQNLVRHESMQRLQAAGMTAEQVQCVLDHVPIATHNQRSAGTLEVTVNGDGVVTQIATPVELADLVRRSMSSSIHELLKREDELAIVERAHADARFVEDCVRVLLQEALSTPLLAHLPPHARLTVRQVNHESIHAHDVVATRSGTLEQLRAELAGH